MCLCLGRDMHADAQPQCWSYSRLRSSTWVLGTKPGSSSREERALQPNPTHTWIFSNVETWLKQDRDCGQINRGIKNLTEITAWNHLYLYQLKDMSLIIYVYVEQNFRHPLNMTGFWNLKVKSFFRLEGVSFESMKSVVFALQEFIVGDPQSVSGFYLTISIVFT